MTSRVRRASARASWLRTTGAPWRATRTTSSIVRGPVPTVTGSRPALASVGAGCPGRAGGAFAGVSLGEGGSRGGRAGCGGCTAHVVHWSARVPLAAGVRPAYRLGCETPHRAIHIGGCFAWRARGPWIPSAMPNARHAAPLASLESRSLSRRGRARSPPPARRTAPRGDQLVVGPRLHEPALVEHRDPVGVPHGREPVRDGDRRPTRGPARRGPAAAPARSPCPARSSPRRGRAPAGRAGWSAPRPAAAAHRRRTGDRAPPPPSRGRRAGTPRGRPPGPPRAPPRALPRRPRAAPAAGSPAPTRARGSSPATRCRRPRRGRPGRGRARRRRRR